MNFSKYNIYKISLSFLLSLGLLLIGYWFYGYLGVLKPVATKLANIPLVKESTITRTAKNWEIEFELGQTASLRETFLQIVQLIPEKDNYSLTIIDHRDNYLKDLWQQNRFLLEEGAATSNFIAIQDRLETDLSQADIDAWLLEVDGDNLYFQLTAGQSYLYEIIPRHGSTFKKIEHQKGTSIKGGQGA